MKAGRVSIIAILCLTILSQALAQQSKPQRKAEEILTYCFQIADLAGEEIWQGFKPRNYAFVNLAADATGYTLGFTNAPNNPEQRTLLASYEVRGYELEEAISLGFHESFHIFESDKNRAGAKWRHENALLVALYPETEARLSALFHIEGQILFAALRTSDDKTLKRLLQQFLALRKLRRGEMEERFAEFEKGAESNEGLAEYAGAKALLIAIREASEKRLALPLRYADEASFIKSKYAKLDSITEAGKNSRLRFYYTGSAQALLLDHLMKDWKRRVQFDGAVLEDLLAEALQFAAASSQPLAEATLKQYDFSSVLKREAENVAKKQAQKQAVLDAILSQKGLRYVIDFSAIGKMGSVKFFDPMNITVVNKEKRVHTRMLHIGEEGLYAGDFEQSVVEDFQNRQYLTIVEATDNQITADGVKLDISQPVERTFKEKLQITTPKFTFEAASGTVTITKDAVIVKLRQGKAGAQ
jgi:hypothetical protein